MAGGRRVAPPRHLGPPAASPPAAPPTEGGASDHTPNVFCLVPSRAGGLPPALRRAPARSAASLCGPRADRQARPTAPERLATSRLAALNTLRGTLSGGKAFKNLSAKPGERDPNRACKCRGPLSRPYRGQCLPSFMVIGSQKAATSTLRWYLSRHPAIDIPKEEAFHGGPNAVLALSRVGVTVRARMCVDCSTRARPPRPSEPPLPGGRRGGQSDRQGPRH